MSKKSEFIEYVKHGGKKIMCSPQIGAGAGYDSKLSGKEIVKTTIDDTIAVCERYNIHPLYNLGVNIGSVNPSKIKTETVYEKQLANGTETASKIPTPYGDLVTKFVYRKEHGVLRTKAPLVDADDLDAVEWYLDMLLEGKYEQLGEEAANAVNWIGDRGAVDFQFGLQPYELFSLSDTNDNVMLAYDEPERFKQLMDKVLEINRNILVQLGKAKADFVFLGGPAAEMVSPMIYDEYMVPWGRRATDYAHENGLLVYSHVCSPVEPFLSKGYFNQLGIDLFETLTPPPLGNVKSIEDAFSKCDRKMCTRGNVGIDVLINGTPDDVIERVYHICEMTKLHNRKHMVAASDYLMAECKEENVQALVDTVEEWNKKNSLEPIKE